MIHLNKGLVYKNGEYHYISDKGICYELLHGVSIGHGRKYNSDTLIVFLDTYVDCDDEVAYAEYYKYASCSRVLVGFWQMDGPDETCGINETVLAKEVSSFEEKNSGLIDCILRNHITTSYWEYGNGGD